MHEESRRLHVELFGDVFADLDERRATLAAGTRFRFMVMLNARQMLGQGLPTGALPGSLRRLAAGRIRRRLGQFGLGGGDVAGQGLLEQVALLDGQGLALCAEAHPAQMRQLQHEGLNLGLGGEQLRIAAGDLFGQTRGFGIGLGNLLAGVVEQFLKGGLDPVRRGEIGLAAGQFSA